MHEACARQVSLRTSLCDTAFLSTMVAAPSRGKVRLLTIGKSSLLQDLNYYKAVRVGPITHRIVRDRAGVKVNLKKNSFSLVGFTEGTREY
jgi:hypothetical protein